MKELKITEDKVLRASETCPDAKQVLKELFPEVFEEDENRRIDPAKLRIISLGEGSALAIQDPDNPVCFICRIYLPEDA